MKAQPPFVTYIFRLNRRPGLEMADRTHCLICVLYVAALTLSPGYHTSFLCILNGENTAWPPRASKGFPFNLFIYKFPPMTRKPRFWWRTLACIPYLLLLHETWMHARTTYHLCPFFNDLEYATYLFFQALGSLPRWWFLAYFVIGYLFVVRRKEWPHFFRYHLVLAMLLEIGYAAIGVCSRWIPRALCWGKIGIHFWTFLAFSHFFTVLDCMRFALCGTYADVPIICDAAYVQIPYE